MCANQSYPFERFEGLLHFGGGDAIMIANWFSYKHIWTKISSNDSQAIKSRLPYSNSFVTFWVIFVESLWSFIKAIYIIKHMKISIWIKHLINHIKHRFNSRFSFWFTTTFKCSIIKLREKISLWKKNRKRPTFHGQVLLTRTKPFPQGRGKSVSGTFDFTS